MYKPQGKWEPVYQTSICKFILLFLSTNAYRAHPMYRALPTALGDKAVNQVARNASSCETHTLGSASSRQQLFIENLLCVRYIGTHDRIYSYTEFPLQKKAGDVSMKVTCLLGGGCPTLQMMCSSEQQLRVPGQASSSRGHFWGQGYPGANVLSPLTLSASHNGFWEPLLSLWLHTPCLPREGYMMKWRSIFSPRWCQAPRHHDTEWAPQWLEGEQFWVHEEWGGRHGRGEGKAAPFHSARELLWVP